MRRTSTALVIALSLTGACAEPAPPGPAAPAPTPPPVQAPEQASAQAPAKPPAFAYPKARKGDVVEVHHGVKVADPYRWLEDMDSAESRAWINAENALTDSYFATIKGREELRGRIAELFSFEAFSLPLRRGGRYFFRHRDGKKNQAVVLTAASLDAAPSLLLDPNEISTDGSLALARFTPTEDGTRLAYGLSIAGGDWQKWRVRDITTGKDLPEELEHIKYYMPVFTADKKGIYYSRFPKPAPGKELTETDHDCKVYLHRIGTPVASDVVVYERPDKPTWQFDLTATHDGHYLVITLGDGQVGDRGEEQIAYLDIKKPGAKVVPLIAEYESEYIFLGNEGPVFYFQTTLSAKKKRVIAIDTRAPARDKWKEIVPEGPNAINGADMVGKQILVTTLKDAHSAVTAYDLQGKKLREVTLPGLGTAFGFDGSPGDKDTFYYFTSFTTPGAIYRYDLATGESKLWKAPKVHFDEAKFETTQVFFPSKDGTKVPMFLTAKKGLTREGQNPVIATAYGFGGVSLTPYFDAAMIAWMERGGVFAVVNIRGGGEYGEEWHHAAMRVSRQVGISDFIAAGEWLVANKYTSLKKLGIMGASGGGLLVGAATMQRPDLFGASVPLVGVHDLLRFQLFGQGAGWQGDMGSPDDPAEFAALYAYSPLHNVRPGTSYPPMLIITSDHDVRVAPLHSYKFAAALQAAQAGSAPVLLSVRTTSGHGGGTMLSQRIEQTTDLLSFFAQNLGL